MTTYSSYLRVYEPLSAFPPAERRTWESYAASGSAPDPVSGIRVESRAALIAAIGGTDATSIDHAFVQRRDGLTYVCPWRTRVRAWAALTEFRRSLPDEIADAFFSRAQADVAERELVRWRASQPELKSHIRSETWQVPLRWFLLFEGEERSLVLSGVRSVTYLTT
ncbi:MAG: hypothetical protein L0221_01900, partial [Chloroflexi bacterium]|nr:hypothetical protein [Chloroflexota bacterium]